MQRQGALHGRLGGVNSCLPIPLPLHSCRRFSSVYCNSDESMPIWLLTLIGKEAPLWAEVWAEESRRVHQGRPLSLLELPGTTEGHTLIYEYADRNLHTSLSTWLLPYAKEPPGSPYFRQHDILTFTLPTVLLSLESTAVRLARGWKSKKMETFSSGSTLPALPLGVRAWKEISFLNSC